MFLLIAHGGIEGRAELLGMLQAVVKVRIIIVTCVVHKKSFLGRQIRSSIET